LGGCIFDEELKDVELVEEFTLTLFPTAGQGGKE
jgi:hypothetical protein